ncbi:hypothetical protein VNI00_000078 [Paramarasmius palmivorus]|uniref:C2H2-type domain-containing protein n=1 Tax=Paramarasmius palmivorus TaxID=297713 RepID=A0AAW0EEP3_9AGAR
MSRIICPYAGCIRSFKLSGHLTKHIHVSHPNGGSLRWTQDVVDHSATILLSQTPVETPPPPILNPDPFSPLDHIIEDEEFQEFNYHPYLTGEKCDREGNPLPPGAPPEPLADVENPWQPFRDEVSFQLADLLFRKIKMSKPNVNELLDLWLLDIKTQFNGDSAPLANHPELVESIDKIREGSAPWNCFESVIEEDLGQDTPDWKKVTYQVWYRNPDTVISNILANCDFANEFDVCPYVRVGPDGKCHLSDFMSGNYAFRHSVCYHAHC